MLIRLARSLILLASLAGFSASVFAAPGTHVLGNYSSSATAQAACVAEPKPSVGYGEGGACQVSGTYGWYWWRKEAAVSGSAYYYYVIVASCSSGEVFNSAGKCVPACTVPGKTSLPATDPLCVVDPPPPPQCQAGPDGTFATKLENGVNVTTYCDGTCEFNLLYNNDTTYCWSYDDQPGTFCLYDKVKNGQSCSLAQSPLPDTSTPTPENSHEKPTCPTGYNLDDATGLCVGGGSSGTPTSTDSPGTAGTPDQYTCPVGYAQNPDGTCAAPGNENVGCPAGYTRNSQGQCTAQTSIPDASAGTGATPAGPVGYSGTLYTPSSRTAQSVIQGFTNAVSQALWYQSAQQFFSIDGMGSGSCDGMSYTTPSIYGQSMTIDLGEFFCGPFGLSLFHYLSVGLMLGASWAAFRIAFL